VIDKVGGIVAGLTYGAKKDSALEHFERAAKLFPESPIVRIEYANGLIRLFGKTRLDDATKLYEQAAAAKPADAMERLDVELAKKELA
jgi:predicted Zn-dependent protease